MAGSTPCSRRGDGRALPRASGSRWRIRAARTRSAPQLHRIAEWPCCPDTIPPHEHAYVVAGVTVTPWASGACRPQAAATRMQAAARARNARAALAERHEAAGALQEAHRRKHSWRPSRDGGAPDGAPPGATHAARPCASPSTVRAKKERRKSRESAPEACDRLSKRKEEGVLETRASGAHARGAVAYMAHGAPRRAVFERRGALQSTSFGGRA